MLTQALTARMSIACTSQESLEKYDEACPACNSFCQESDGCICVSTTMFNNPIKSAETSKCCIITLYYILCQMYTILSSNRIKLYPIQFKHITVIVNVLDSHQFICVGRSFKHRCLEYHYGNLYVVVKETYFSNGISMHFMIHRISKYPVFK